MYTSLLNVKQAISVERKLINYLKTYIDHESERLEDVKRFYAKVSDLHTELYKGPATVMANPLVAFTLIKRLHSDPALRSSYEKEEADLPKLEDLQGAAQGLMRLQDVYVLQVASLVRGLFQRVTEGQPIDIYRPAVSVPLSGDDCFLVGKVAYEQQDYYHSVQWLEESAMQLHTQASYDHQGVVVIPFFCVFLCCIVIMLRIFATNRHFLDNSRYILFAYMLINDTLQLLSSVILFLLVMCLVTFPTVYCVPLLLLSASTFMNTTLILATMSLERYVAIIYPLQCPAAWRSDRIWIIILSIWFLSFIFPMIEYSIGERDPAVDIPPHLCSANPFISTYLQSRFVPSCC
ncbi:Prolyl 4-hydroxylase subunit alpha-3 [Dissostichus eleginoides]|uniref:Prolyl 4-hydroxylase subunit alpha-3 n=1 Tax=Dissostichus eleginoides TaxID=100907 RepID=A0AAD9CF89_DISEL|nr:Prolyl 4-hydroxylase subunit alpha-3 [Dissostichus eleginoides]